MFNLQHDGRDVHGSAGDRVRDVGHVAEHRGPNVHGCRVTGPHIRATEENQQVQVTFSTSVFVGLDFSLVLSFFFLKVS